MRQVYESCVIDAAGRCTRWSHDHSDDPTERADGEVSRDRDGDHFGSKGSPS